MLNPYALKGPQIEPEAAHWTFSGYRIRVIDIHNDHPTGTTVPPFNDDPAFLEREIEELIDLAGKRSTPGAIGGTFPDSGGFARERLPLSEYFSLRPPPITAQFNTDNWTVLCGNGNPAPPVRPIENVIKPCRSTSPLVNNGQELARMFEDETPGLMHRHALNCLLFNRSVSPPRQARIWMALDVTIYSALLAAWHIKWGHKSGQSPDLTRSYVQRPIEYEIDQGSNRFTVLYDTQLLDNGTEGGGRRCPEPFVSPGTPRHPAYPSGHSTYSAAASRILEYFFSEDTLDQDDSALFELARKSQVNSGPRVAAELRRLADNIGMARLWAGVHWRQDHTTGQRLGKWVADQVIRDLCRDPVRPLPEDPPMRCNATIMPPDFDDVEDFKQYRLNLIQKGECEDDQDTIPPPPAGTSIQDFQGQRGGI